MAINIEVKHRLKALEDRIKALEEKTACLDHPFFKPRQTADQPVIAVPVELDKPKKLCPKCGVKPAYFFHVKHCRGQKQQDGDDRNRDPRNP